MTEHYPRTVTRNLLGITLSYFLTRESLCRVLHRGSDGACFERLSASQEAPVRSRQMVANKETIMLS